MRIVKAAPVMAKVRDDIDQVFDRMFRTTFAPEALLRTPDEGTPDEGTIDPETIAARTELRDALGDAQQAIEDGQAALADGDFAAYGKAQDALAAALGRAMRAEERLDAGAVVPEVDMGNGATPSPSATADQASS